MTLRRRDPLRATRRAHHAEKMARARESMSPHEVRAAMMRIIRERLERDGDAAEITLDDFRRANLPMEMVPGLFKAALTSVQNVMALERE